MKLYSLPTLILQYWPSTLIKRWYIYLIYMFIHCNRLVRGSWEPPSSFSYPLSCSSTLWTSFLPHPLTFLCPILANGVGHFSWILMCSCNKGHCRAVRVQGSILPVNGNFGNSRCFFFPLHPLSPHSQEPSSWNKPCFVPFLEDSDKAHI